MKSGNYTEKILNRRKALMVLLIISILASVFCIDFPVNAAGTRQGVINGTYVNVRNGSGTYTTTVIGQLTSGDSVVINYDEKDVDGDLWYNVTCQAKGITGYVFNKYVSISVDYTYDGDFESYLNAQGFPESYKPYLRQLHQKYPKWIFTVDRINMNFADVVAGEASAFARNLTPANNWDWCKSTASGAYDWGTNTWTPLDNGSWVAASDAIISFYMDPRNFLDETKVFMFENLSYNPAYHTLAGVESICAGTFMDKAYSVEGTTYPAMIMEAARQSGVSPYYLASSILQEHGTDGDSALISGTYSGYNGYYNFYNIGASGKGSTAIIINGLTTAKNNGWNSRYKSIVGGANWFADGYVSQGQDTVYYKKFDLIGNLYTHQYMQNIGAAKSEASIMAAAYTQTMKQNTALVFKIPVYNNMPGSAVTAPASNLNPNNMLKSLSVSGYNLTPTFKYYTNAYSLNVANSVTSVNISASPVAGTSRVSGTGTKSLSVGANTFNIDVTAENGKTNRYIITIVRANGSSGGNSSGGGSSTGGSGTNTGSTTSKISIGYKTSTSGSTKLITGVEPGTTVSQASSKINANGNIVKYYDKNGNETSGSIGTGTVVKEFDSTGKTLISSYTIVIYGDVNGDGTISTSDVLAMRRHLFGYVKLSGVYATAADTNKDGSVASTSDILALRRHLFGYVRLTQ